eukprot:GHVN01071433.1.p1 GENE.GHVN01071433.1~~GHVN01071433.1.p1  ORF type:complete len:115 (+),score=6.30 GHVN01071433.1:262-606(+)
MAAPLQHRHVFLPLNSSIPSVQEMLLEDLRFPWWVYIILSGFYASYHFVVFFHLLGGWVWAASAFLFLTGVGRLFIYFRNEERYGIATAIGCHMGIDTGAVLCLATSILQLNKT